MSQDTPKIRRALIVDDEPMVSNTLRIILARDGYAVEVASDGEQGLTLFEAGKFDLVLVDYEMPKIKGDRLAMLIKQRDPRQPIIMVTAHGEMLRAAGNALMGIDQIVEKPFGLEALREGITQVLAKYAKA